MLTFGRSFLCFLFMCWFLFQVYSFCSTPMHTCATCKPSSPRQSSATSSSLPLPLLLVLSFSLWWPWRGQVGEFVCRVLLWPGLCGYVEKSLSLWPGYVEKSLSLWPGYVEKSLSLWPGYVEKSLSLWPGYVEKSLSLKQKKQAATVQHKGTLNLNLGSQRSAPSTKHFIIIY